MGRALISVYNKDGIEKLAAALHSLGWEIVATSGTAKILEKIGIKAIPVESLTHHPEAFDGRMKSISFQIEAAILFDRGSPEHLKTAKELNIVPIDLVVCNFYPFLDAVAGGKYINEIIEMIDVGGPTMARAAAKNFKHVAVLISPSQYPWLIKELEEKKEISLDLRKKLASEAFYALSEYDANIGRYFNNAFLNKRGMRMNLKEGRKLRYGENPHQEGYFYSLDVDDSLSLSNFNQIQGKELSFNNLLDIDRALYVLCLIGQRDCACVVVKHGNPCGAALRENPAEAFLSAWEGDSLAAFGGIVAVNRTVEKELAELMLKDKRFFEVLIAPSVSDEAKSVFQKKQKLIILENKNLLYPVPSEEFDYKKVRGGFLVQSPEAHDLKKEELKFPTDRKPSADELEDLFFAWNICRGTLSNTIIIAKDKMLASSGAGQQDRFRACRLAVMKAEDRAKGAVAASDAFFPFPDGPEVLLKAGITAIIQPGGSIRDKETIDICNRYSAAMVFTGARCFKH